MKLSEATGYGDHIVNIGAADGLTFNLVMPTIKSTINHYKK